MPPDCDDRSEARPRRSTWGLGLAALWAASIFATSCTVVRPQELFQWMGKYVLPGDASLRGFILFWGMAWFVVVKGWHAIEFAVLCTLCQAALAGWRGKATAGTCLAALMFCVLFAASDEWHQTFVSGRGGAVSDVLIDSAGAIAATVRSLRRIQRPKK